MKQAGRHWYKTLERILFIHVDDITIIGKDLFVIRVFKKNLAKHVKLSDGGDIHWLLGIEIQRNRSLRTIKMRQKHYIDSIIKHFGFENEQSYQSPMHMDVQLTSMGEITHDQQEYMDCTPYMNMIGALQYAADQTRPDILYVTGQLA